MKIFEKLNFIKITNLNTSRVYRDNEKASHGLGEDSHNICIKL